LHGSPLGTPFRRLFRGLCESPWPERAGCKPAACQDWPPYKQPRPHCPKRLCTHAAGERCLFVAALGSDVNQPDSVTG
jgi:hypothetical protein